MRFLKKLCFLSLFFILMLGKPAYAAEEKTILILDPMFNTVFGEKLIEGLESSFSQYNIKILHYIVNNPDEEFEIQNIKHIAEKNNSIAIISLGVNSNKLLRKYSTGYLDKFRIHTFDNGLTDFKFPSNFKTHRMNFDLEKKLDAITSLHKVTTVNFLIDKDFLSSIFYIKLQDYLFKNPNLTSNFILVDEWQDSLDQLKLKDSLTVIFSCISDTSNGLKSKITPFGSIEKIARFTDNPIYGGFADFGTRFNIGAFNYSGLLTGDILASAILTDLKIISDNKYADHKAIKSFDFLINEDLNSYGIKNTDTYSIKSYSFKGNTTFANEKKLSTFKIVFIICFIFLIYLFIKNKMVRKLYREQIKVDSLKTNFIANISHELRTPLNIIISTISLFEIYIKNGEVSLNSENSIEKFNYLKKNSYRLLKLINNIIDTTRIDAGYFLLDKKTYNIVEVIEDICLSTVAYAEKKSIAVIFDTNFEEVYTLFDKDKIERVALNLLSNALKFTPAGGNIYVLIDKVDTNTVAITFKDTGVGITKENQKNIFDRFVQASDSLNKSEGSGIGLSLCKSIALQHNGNITIQSAPGVGSTFTLFLPIIVDTISETKNLSNSKISELTEIEFSDH